MFQIAAGSVPGSNHTMPGQPSWKNNQDAFFTYTSDDITIGIIADGCGSGNKSEVGASLGVRLWGEILLQEAKRNVHHGIYTYDKWDRSQNRLLGSLSNLVYTMGESISQTVEEYFLFSLVGFVIMPETCSIFHCGDGSYTVNDTLTQVGPFPNNAPPYIAYNILGNTSSFEVIEFETSTIEHISVASDGVDYIPHYHQQVQEWLQDDKIFQNPDVLRRRLSKIAKDTLQEKRIIPGKLKDDTSLVIARKNR